jgi:hypothetical protein
MLMWDKRGVDRDPPLDRPPRDASRARSTLRELIIPFGTTGYILRFDIRSPELVLVIGARHQREEDFH